MRITPVSLVLIVLVIALFAGGRFYGGGAYATPGYGLGTVLFILLILFLFGIL